MLILHVIPSLSVRTGGPAFSTSSCALAVQYHGAKVTILTTDQSAPAQSFESFGPVCRSDFPPAALELDVRVHPVRSPARWSYSPSLARELDRIAASADLIHVHSLYLHPQFAAWRAARDSNTPYIVSPRGALDPYLRGRSRTRKWITNLLWQRRMLDQASAIHLTSKAEMDLIADLQFDPPHVVVPNGLDVDAFAQLPDRQMFRDRYLGSFSGQLLLNHGRISQKKGLDILIDAFAEVLEAHPETRLAVVGPDDEGLGNLLRQRAAQRRLASFVSFVGQLQGSDLTEALASADVWVLPSHTENFGLAVAEAMAAGLTVVTSPHVNIAPEAAAAGALVMVDNDPALIAAEITKLLDDQARRTQLGERAREYVKRFDWKELGPQYIAMYNDAIEYHQHRGPYKRRLC